jgi:hypothetical protein
MLCIGPGPGDAQKSPANRARDERRESPRRGKQMVEDGLEPTRGMTAQTWEAVDAE